MSIARAVSGVVQELATKSLQIPGIKPRGGHSVQVDAVCREWCYTRMRGLGSTLGFDGRGY